MRSNKARSAAVTRQMVEIEVLYGHGQSPVSSHAAAEVGGAHAGILPQGG
jgi:hypothetical protein